MLNFYDANVTVAFHQQSLFYKACFLAFFPPPSFNAQDALPLYKDHKTVKKVEVSLATLSILDATGIKTFYIVFVHFLVKHC